MKLGYQALGFILWFALAACDYSSFDAPNTKRSGITSADATDEKLRPEGADDGDKLANPGGVAGGHFDLDTSISTYPFSKGKTEHHVHEYDDKFNVAGVDFFNMIDEKFVDIKEGIPRTDQPFVIIIGNAALSPGAVLHINGTAYDVASWTTLAREDKTPTFVLGRPASGQTQLTSFKIAFDKSKSIDGQLIPTQTKNVVANDPGPGGAYRHGALTIQALDATQKTLDAALGVAPIGSTGMFWEATLFWHFP